MKILIDSDAMTKYIPERKHSFAEYGTFAIFASVGLFGLVIGTTRIVSNYLNGSFDLGAAFLEIGGGGILKSSIDMML